MLSLTNTKGRIQKALFDDGTNYEDMPY
jgi:hypothetical protein